ncbi:MAG: hypothetical protein QXR96_00140 [Candidatus Woesearchaeota archaeon]
MKNKKNKAQLSIEFIYMIFFGTLFLIIFLSVFSENYKAILQEKKNKLFFDFGNSIKKEISIASEVKNGYERKFFLPEKLENFDYDIKIENNILILNYSNYFLYFYIPKTEGELKKGFNNIKNFNNSIIINDLP